MIIKKFVLLCVTIFVMNGISAAGLPTLLENLKQDLTDLHKQLLELPSEEISSQEAHLRLAAELKAKGVYHLAPLFYTKLFSLPEDLDHITPHLESAIWGSRAHPDLQYVEFKTVPDTFLRFAEMIIIGKPSWDAMETLERIARVKPNAIVVLYVESKEEAEKAPKQVAEINSELFPFIFIIKRESVSEDIEPPYILSPVHKEYNEAQLERLVKRVGARSMSL